MTVQVHELAVMDNTGDTKIIWDPDKKDEVDNAKRTFDDLRKKGYYAYSVDEEGDRKEIITKFDKNAGKIILHKRMVGG